MTHFSFSALPDALPGVHEAMFDRSVRERVGCNCKVGPDQLRAILKVMHPAAHEDVIVGFDGRDDAAVWKVSETDVVVASVDFQNPVVDDYAVAGGIAAANALSDIFAMGFTPQFANVFLSVCEGPNLIQSGRELLCGVQESAAAAGCVIVGGHTFAGLEPLCGLSVFGRGPRRFLKRKSGARAGDAIILTKPLGSGILIAAAARAYDVGDEYIQTMLRLNSAGAWLGGEEAVHALTDVSGFGLIGHACEMARASAMTLHVRAQDVPRLRGALRYADEAVTPELGRQTIAAFADHVTFGAPCREVMRTVLADPQTNGGLLIAVEASRASEIEARLRAGGDAQATIIGYVAARHDEALLHIE